MVTPYRAVFEDRTRSQVLTLINRSDSVATFRMEWFNTIVDQDGNYETIKPEDPRYTSIKRADDFIRYSPRQVTLAPGDKQAVRIAVRKPANLEEGEYRSHLSFKQLSDPREQSNAEAGINLSLNLSISIPVIIRHGDLNVDAKINSVSHKKNYGENAHDEFIVSVTRSGEASSYGSIKFYDFNDTNKENIIALVNNVSIFPETTTRDVSVPIFTPISPSIKKFRVVYEGKNEYNKTIFDEFTYERP